ncbi:zinc finger MYM-type protein 1-like [Misgurnus anguillicaudatus]|uniref:zinc finger MYM-type protein 1-like n=1 Tax=Misgurnus anguillicaudatus TaxID=75329 RepID=UPI003CCF3485
MLSWHSFKSSAAHGTVIEQLHSANESEIKDRREYLTRIVAVTQFLAKQNIPFHGHEEGSSSHNQGNFLECLNLLKQFDPFLQSYSARSNSTYLSPASQNEIIESCAEEVTANIVREVKEAGMFSVMADEARDGNTEQLAICVRYVAESVVKECLLAMKTLKEFDAECITTAIEEELVFHGLDKLKCVAQSYDGAAVMSGAVGGVQARFKANHPEAVYVHCYAHQLNLVLCHTCQAIPEAKDLFDLLQSVNSFFSVSLVNHQKFKDVQNQLGLQPSELVQLSKTRWSSQLRSVNAILKNLPAVLQCLSSINNSMAVGLHAKLSRFSTIYLLMMFKNFLSVTENLHIYLQSETIDLAKAAEYKGAVCDTLRQMRTDEKAVMLYDTVRTICAANQVPEPCTATRQRQKQKRMEVYVVDSSCGTVSDLSDAEKLKRNLYLPCLDRMVGEMDQRFSSLNEQILKGLQACNPGSDSFLCLEHLRGLADHYNVDLRTEEVLVAKNYLAHKKESLSIKDIQCVFNLLDKVMFPSLTQVMQISLTIPVNSCSCERSFSVLRRLHTWLRCSMGQDRLHHLAVLSVEREELCKLSQSQVIDRFAKMKNRLYSLMLKN